MPRFLVSSSMEHQQAVKRFRTTVVCDGCDRSVPLGRLVVVGPYAFCADCVGRLLQFLESNEGWLRDQYNRLARLTDGSVRRASNGLVYTASGYAVQHYWQLLAFGVRKPRLPLTL